MPEFGTQLKRAGGQAFLPKFPTRLEKDRLKILPRKSIAQNSIMQKIVGREQVISIILRKSVS